MPDYNLAEEARLMQYNNASNEVLVGTTRYALDGDVDKYIEMGYSTYLNLESLIRIRDGCGDFGSGGCQVLLNKNSVLLTIEEWKTLMGLETYLANKFFHDSIEKRHILEQSFKDDLSVRNISRTGDISTEVQIYYNWEHTEGLSSPMTKTMSAVARNNSEHDFKKYLNRRENSRRISIRHNKNYNEIDKHIEKDCSATENVGRLNVNVFKVIALYGAHQKIQ
ncbi:hypothetical protein FQA39_LY13232 [Lamprigera yunnana]|nr:hypothetical protein FQA39_LY13232 [Lamprigera yunnana]